MRHINVKVLSSLEKCFSDESLSSKKEESSFVMFRNERLAFQLAYELEDCPGAFVCKVEVHAVGPLAEYIKFSRIVSVPSFWAAGVNVDDNYLRTEPGLYPDMIAPLQYNGKAVAVKGQLHSVWVEVRLPEDFRAGTYGTDFEFIGENGEYGSAHVSVTVASAVLPKQKTIHTEWFYTDCIAQYYGAEVFGEKHWELIENFMLTAADNGINMILTPVLTPELDTYIGGERLTTQLVDIKVSDGNSYEFGFGKLDRWIDTARKCGIEYFEISHLFTQWGAEHAPKVVATVGNVEKKIFGWETDSLSDEYKMFLGAFLPELISYLKAKGVDDKCFFHISDEPSVQNIERYSACKVFSEKYLEGYPITDALSHVEFYKSGVVSKPVPFIGKIDDFLEENIPGLWAYYCGDSGNRGITGRLFAHPSARTRILGVQMYKFDIEGFLHWGYNFYNNRYSYDTVNPYSDSTGNYFVPSGDTYIVYPGENGKALESLRLNALREAMDDIRALELCESFYGKRYVTELIDSIAGRPLTFFDYPKNPEFFSELRLRIVSEIEKASGGKSLL